MCGRFTLVTGIEARGYELEWYEKAYVLPASEVA